MASPLNRLILMRLNRMFMRVCVKSFAIPRRSPPPLPLSISTIGLLHNTPIVIRGDHGYSLAHAGVYMYGTVYSVHCVWCVYTVCTL